MKAGIVGLFAAGLVFGASAAHADPIVVTGGFVNSDLVVTGVDLITQSFSVILFGEAGADGRPIINMPGFGHVNAGEIGDFSATVNGPLVNVGLPETVIDGVTYRNQGDLLATANLRFNATPVLVTPFDVTTPFTMTGSLQVFRNAGTLSIRCKAKPSS